MTDLWKVARVDEQRVTQAQRDELFVWLRSLGVEPGEMRPVFAVTEDTDRTYRLHLTRFVKDGGRLAVDYAANDPVTVPVVIPITEFPAWLPAVSQQQGVS